MTHPSATTGPRPQRVYFYATCVVDLMAPGAGYDAIELMRGAGIEVDFPRAQSCCGQPAYSSGYLDEARRVARAQLALFPEPWPIVVPSGSCASMMAHDWARLFAGAADAAQAQAVAARVIEFSACASAWLGIGGGANGVRPRAADRAAAGA
ncbi:MAG: (Fe-S)-binding protein, partial [Burkholderiales bacterium]|nr:(Fe-S)-binding protein [Burkholderiales bacterium]